MYVTLMGLGGAARSTAWRLPPRASWSMPLLPWACLIDRQKPPPSDLPLSPAMAAWASAVLGMFAQPLDPVHAADRAGP